jgi:hypothetical protein
MSEEKEEEPLATGEMERPFDEREERSTSIDVTDTDFDRRSTLYSTRGNTTRRKASRGGTSTRKT